MSRDIKTGRWFQLETKAQHDKVLAFGRLDPSGTSGQARVQRGNWSGPGWYMLLAYSQRCPRNCCYDDVHEILPASNVATEAAKEMQDLAGQLKDARTKSKPIGDTYA